MSLQDASGYINCNGYIICDEPLLNIVRQTSSIKAKNLDYVTLTGNDNFRVKAGQLFIYNPTASDAEVRITGSTAAGVNIKGYGVFDTSAGLPVNVPAGQTVMVKLDYVKGWMEGLATILGGSGLKAAIAEI